MILQDINSYSTFSTGMYFPQRYRKVATRYGNKIHLATGSAPLCGSGSGWNRHPHVRYHTEQTAVTCEKCLEHERFWRQQAWLIFMEAEH